MEGFWAYWPRQKGVHRFHLFSHKFLRWSAWVFMVGAYLSCRALPGPFYAMLTLLQEGFYGLAALGFLTGGKVRLPGFNLPFYFVTLNMAALVGSLRYVLASAPATWTPTSK
jgi:hypothetical protein